MSDTITLSGTIADVFAHRFTLTTDTGTVLADLGPKGAERITPATGDAVTITGERKPSEIKVTSLTRRGETVDLSHDKGPDHAPADPKPVLAAVEKAGLAPLGEPRRKPKHFEVLARDRDGHHHELHVAFDGTVSKRKPVAADDAKWAEALKVA